MGKAQKENGFMLYAKDLRRRFSAKGERHLEWETFKTRASEHWSKLTKEEQNQWKLEAKIAKLEARQKGREKLGNPGGSDDSVYGDLKDEVDILEKFPRKHYRDVKKITDQWDWDYGTDREKQKEKRFLLISCQYYYQEYRLEHSIYVPAEIAVLEWSLNGGIHQDFHQIFPLNQKPSSQHSVEEMHHRSKYIHGIGNKSPSPYYACDIAAVYDTLSTILRRHSRIYCFAHEFLDVSGALDWLSQEIDPGQPLLTNRTSRLICVEDLFSAMVKWDRLSSSIDCDNLRDMFAVVRKCSSDWSTNLCDFHSQVQLEQIGESEDASGSVQSQFICSAALVREAVTFIRKWLAQQQIDQWVLDAFDSHNLSFDLRLLDLDEKDSKKSFPSSNFTLPSGAKEDILCRFQGGSRHGFSGIGDDNLSVDDWSRHGDCLEAYSALNHELKEENQPPEIKEVFSWRGRSNKQKAEALNGKAKPINTINPSQKKIADIGSWNDVQASMPVGFRGLGRGLALMHWNTFMDGFVGSFYCKCKCPAHVQDK